MLVCGQTLFCSNVGVNMSNSFAEFVIGLRNMQAKLVAFAMVVLFCWAIFSNYSQPNLISKDSAIGEIVSTGTSGEGKNNQILMIEIKVEGDVFRSVVIQKPFPKVGDKVPVLIEAYSDESKILIFDEKKFQQRKSGY